MSEAATAITFATCWYNLSHSKFPSETYLQWIDNFLMQVVHFYLVVFTDAEGERSLAHYAAANSAIRIVVKPLHELRGWAYRPYWQRNHVRNTLLNGRTPWELNMIWCEKVHFVAEVREKKFGFPETEFYGWCDIGYFRGRPGEDLPKTALADFARPDRVRAKITPRKIHYALVNPDAGYLENLYRAVQRRGANGLPQIPPNQVSIAGGFFVGASDIIPGWQSYFAERLAQYIEADALVKDDQIVVVDCVFSRPGLFELHREFSPPLDPWFLFQRVLTPPPPPR